jgi:hypothetical protein
MTTGAPGSLVATDTAPLKLPASVGANATAKVWLSLGASVSGIDKPEPLKQVPVTTSWAMVMLPTPVLVSEMPCVAVLPTNTSPKVIEAGLAESVPAGISCTTPRPHDAANPYRTTIAANNAPPILVVIIWPPPLGVGVVRRVASRAQRRVVRTELEVRKRRRNRRGEGLGRQPIHRWWQSSMIAEFSNQSASNFRNCNAGSGCAVRRPR